MLRIVPRLDWREIWVYDVLLANKIIQRDYLSRERAEHYIRCVALPFLYAAV